eukprot:CAMPEP_0171638110 /NCGR_PEP_ID=MMETSP0990-20121206/28701_1 /TAXON_ID=483369 /ORGANISM="non described non described, Strain CCMP2098" /LENGTH=147 /DNA_ID=CAMNT_0012211151 /DNA_START=918 /DNA_END=1361 /DNA_ORIENTATION=+
MRSMFTPFLASTEVTSATIPALSTPSTLNVPARILFCSMVLCRFSRTSDAESRFWALMSVRVTESSGATSPFGSVRASLSAFFLPGSIDTTIIVMNCPPIFTIFVSDTLPWALVTTALLKVLKSPTRSGPDAITITWSKPGSKGFVL